MKLKLILKLTSIKCIQTQKTNKFFPYLKNLNQEKIQRKKTIPPFSSKIYPLFQSKLKKNPNKNLNNSNSFIMFDGQDKPTIDKIISINYRNKKPQNTNSLSTSSSNFLFFQKSVSNHHSNNPLNVNKHHTSNHHIGTNLQITNQNIISSTHKSQNPSANNSIVFTPFSNNTVSTNPMPCTVKNKKFKSASNSIPHDNNNNNNNHSKSDSAGVDNKVNVLLNELNKQLKECPNEGDINKIIDKKFNIIKTSYYNFVKMLPSETQQNFLLNVMEMITTILNFKNDQISELTTNSSLEHHIHPYNKKKVPLNQMYAKQIVRMTNKQSKEQEKQMLSKTVNVLRKETVDSDESEEDTNTNKNNGISTTEERELLQEIQFCDKVKLNKHNSMQNLNLPKLDFNFILGYYGNTRNKKEKKQQTQHKHHQQIQHVHGINYTSIIGMKKTCT